MGSLNILIEMIKSPERMIKKMKGRTRTLLQILQTYQDNERLLD